LTEFPLGNTRMNLFGSFIPDLRLYCKRSLQPIIRLVITLCISIPRSFNGQLGYLLRDKNPQSIQKAQELATKIEGNLLSSKIEPFANPRKIDTKPKIVHNTEPTSDLCSSMEKLQASMDGIIKNQELMMSRIVNLERSQS
jgi:hypothetical protein